MSLWIAILIVYAMFILGFIVGRRMHHKRSALRDRQRLREANWRAGDRRR